MRVWESGIGQLALFATGAVLAGAVLTVSGLGSAQVAPAAAALRPDPAETAGAPEAVSGRSLLAAHLEEISPTTVADAGAAPDARNFAVPAPEESQPAGPRILTYTVQPGDTIWDLAQQFAVDEFTVRSLNPGINPKRLRPGQEIKILTVRGTVHEVRRGETLAAIAKLYGVTTAAITQANALGDSNRIQVGMQLIVPGARPTVRSGGTAGGQRPGEGWIWPLRGRITSGFGPRWGSRHDGLDIAAPTGTPARAARAGRVTFAGWLGAYGQTVVVDHGGGVLTRYAHASRILVQRGDWVERGQAVLRVGSTGRSTGPHLHFEIVMAGTARDPRSYLP